MVTQLKYAGADWLQRQIGGQSKPKALSPLGVKVANVLGQVYQGIHRIDSAVLNKRQRWGDPLSISVTIYGTLDTHDLNHLTALVLCCQRAGIGVDVCGSRKGYVRLVFSPERRTLGEVMGTGKYDMPVTGEDPDGCFKQFAERFTGPVKKLQRSGSSFAEFSIGPIDWISLQDLVAQCYGYSIRCSLQGRSPTSLGAVFSQHRPEREPSLEEYTAMLIDIDYESVN